MERLQLEGRFNKSLPPEAIARTVFSLWQSLDMQLMLEPEMDTDAYLLGCKAIMEGSLIN